MANEADNRLITATSTSGVLYAESNLTYNGLDLTIGSTGSVYAAAYFETSDARLKSILIEDYVNHDILAVRAKMFDKEGLTQVGYIAQDISSILPHAVKSDERGYLTIAYTDILVAKVAALEKRIDELENRINQR